VEKQVVFGLVETLTTLKEVDVTGRDLLDGSPVAVQGLLATTLEPEVEERFSLECIQ
jgi:hypothetical protein